MQQSQYLVQALRELEAMQAPSQSPFAVMQPPQAPRAPVDPDGPAPLPPTGEAPVAPPPHPFANAKSLIEVLRGVSGIGR